MMSREYRKICLGILSFFLCCTASAHPDHPHAFPNILLIIADDLGVDASNGFLPGDLLPRTPNLDQLRAEGLSFTNTWATPRCTPSRAAIMSGKYGSKTGVLRSPGHLDVEHRSMFTALKGLSNDAYRGAVIGKWHISSPADPQHPGMHGIDHFEGILNSGVDDYYDWEKITNGVTSRVEEYATSHLTDRAAAWINDQNEPWCLWLSHFAPHSPFHQPPDSLYTIDPVNNTQTRYLAAIEAMDAEIGRLLGSISPAVLANTLIIYIGDNGTPGRVIQNFSANQGKTSLYQGGISVPLIVSGAGVSRKGEVETAMIHAADLYGTVLETAGADLPGGIYNSLSFAHLLTGSSGPVRPFNYSELEVDGSLGWTIRDQRYKFIRFADGSSAFYDLLSDPFETNNRIANLTLEESILLQELEAEANDIQTGWSCQDLILNGDEATIDNCPETGNCMHDNTLSTTNIGCCATPAVGSQYEESTEGGFRIIRTNNFPNHDYCFNDGNPDLIPQPREYLFEVPATPRIATGPTSVLRNNGRPARYFGVALNGVLIAPAPAEPFIFKNLNTGESNWDWVFEPTNTQGNGRNRVALDCSSAHTGPQGYHYHGNMFGYAETVRAGITTDEAPPSEPVQVGWASDGFPILYRFGPDGAGGLQLLQPSYRLKAGDRPGDGIAEPCGPYNGKYTNDYEYVEGFGDLDACNGMARTVTLTTAQGTEAFDYFYVITETFPQIGRCLAGTPDPSFENSNRGTTTSVRGIQLADYGLRCDPNPARNHLQVSYDAAGNTAFVIELLDYRGRQLLTWAPSPAAGHPVRIRTEISLKGIPAGLYLVRVRSESGMQIKKVLKN